MTTTTAQHRRLSMQMLDSLSMPRSDASLSYWMGSLIRAIDEMAAEGELDLDPDFQRPHVWSDWQRIRWIEHILMGGHGGKEIIIAYSGSWASSPRKNLCLLDGKQRVQTIRLFLTDQFRIFHRLDPDGLGFLFSETGEITKRVQYWMILSTVCLNTRADIVDLYLRLNSGGSIHTEEDINRAQEILMRESAGKHAVRGL